MTGGDERRSITLTYVMKHTFAARAAVSSGAALGLSLRLSLLVLLLGILPGGLVI